jgi:hypothetical protein
MCYHISILKYFCKGENENYFRFRTSEVIFPQPFHGGGSVVSWFLEEWSERNENSKS